MFPWRLLHNPQYEKNDNVEIRRELAKQCMINKPLREAAQRVTSANILAMAWVLGYCLVDEEIHKEALAFFPPPDITKTLTEWITESNAKYLRTGTLLLPRGVYKSTLSMTYCTQLLCTFPQQVSIMILTGRANLAVDFVDTVAGFFLRGRPGTPPSLFQAIWPHLCVNSIMRDRKGFTTPLRQKDPPIVEPNLWGESIESGTSGLHPNVLIADDIHTNRNSKDFAGRSNVTKKYKMVKKVLVPTGIEIRIGTIYGSGDTFTDELLSAKPGSIRRVHCPAIRRKDGERIDENDFPEESESIIYFPSILSWTFLKAEWDADWTTFATQFLLDQFGANEIVFPEKDLLAAFVPENQIPMEGDYIMHWRLPCMRRGWYQAVVGVGIISQNRCFIIDLLAGYYKPSMLAKMVINKAREHNLHRISVEDAPGARLMQPAIDNYALVTGWKVSIEWIGGATEDESGEGAGQRDLRIRNTEAIMTSGRLFFSRGLKQTKRLMSEYSQYSMIPDIGFPDVVARIADHLPISIAAETSEHEKLAWKQAQERDLYNLVYARGPYAPPEPEPEPPPRIEDEEYNEYGLPIEIPGLE